MGLNFRELLTKVVKLTLSGTRCAVASLARVLLDGRGGRVGGLSSLGIDTCTFDIVVMR